jgi:hypothetical protein
MPAATPRANGDLLGIIDATRAAWAECAAKLDVVIDCQAKALAGDQGGTHE